MIINNYIEWKDLEKYQMSTYVGTGWKVCMLM